MLISVMLINNPTLRCSILIIIRNRRGLLILAIYSCHINSTANDSNWSRTTNYHGSSQVIYLCLTTTTTAVIVVVYRLYIKVYIILKAICIRAIYHPFIRTGYLLLQGYFVCRCILPFHQHSTSVFHKVIESA